MAAKTSFLRLLNLCTIIATVASIFIFFNHTRAITTSNEDTRTDDSAVKESTDLSTARVPYITFMFNQTAEEVIVDHNCERLTRNGYEFHIFTDNIHQRACATCTCIARTLKPCTCPHPTMAMCDHCHKMHFMVEIMKSMPAFIFIDTDFAILHDVFMPELQSRTQYTDFLAVYAFSPLASWTYNTAFNSGLMFMRRLDNLDYDYLLDIYARMRTNGDQNVISSFVRKFYTRWEPLSLRWHCRFLERPENNIPRDRCLAFHGKRLKRNAFFREQNITLLHTKGY